MWAIILQPYHGDIIKLRILSCKEIDLLPDIRQQLFRLYRWSPGSCPQQSRFSICSGFGSFPRSNLPLSLTGSFGSRTKKALGIFGSPALFFMPSAAFTSGFSFQAYVSRTVRMRSLFSISFSSWKVPFRRSFSSTKILSGSSLWSVK